MIGSRGYSYQNKCAIINAVEVSAAIGFSKLPGKGIANEMPKVRK
jgi:hypothetical protein